MQLNISEAVLDKLTSKHSVTVREIEQCFCNRTGALLEDSREAHKTDPPTQWFIAKTNAGRELKVVFVQRNMLTGTKTDIRTAYQANAEEIRIYSKYGNP